MVSVCSADLAVFDDFSSYQQAGPGRGFQSGTYSANWESGALHPPGDTNQWQIMYQPVYAPEHGLFAGTFGTSRTNYEWLTFTATDTGPIRSAKLSFDYLVQTRADMQISVSSNPQQGFQNVPFSFVKQVNQGQIVDNSGEIDLTPYLSEGSSQISVRFDSVTYVTPYTHVYVDNFKLDTQAVPLPSVACTSLLMLACLAGCRFTQRRRSLA